MTTGRAGVDIKDKVKEAAARPRQGEYHGPGGDGVCVGGSLPLHRPLYVYMYRNVQLNKYIF